MGVKHLLSYLTNNGLLETIVHTPDTPSLDGVVIDGLAFGYHLLEQIPSIPVAGGEYAAFARASDAFFKNLKDMEVPCVVIIDGCSGAEKIPTQVARESARVDYYHQALNASRVGDPPGAMAPIMMKQALAQTLLENGIEFWVSDEEADAAIAHEANDRGWLVLSNDSDFVIFESPGESRPPTF